MKLFNTMSNVGKAKYIVNFHDGISKHKDGSNFFAIEIFTNKQKFNSFIKQLLNTGYINQYSI